MDIFAQAAEAAENAGIRFGQVGEIEGRHVALVKGLPDFDPNIHERRNTQITIRIDPLPESGLSNFDQRNIIAEFNTWTRIVFPSIKALVKNPANWRDELLNQYVKYELVEEPKSKNDTSDYVRTTFKFHAIYSDHAACLAAYEESQGIVHSTQEDDPAMDVDMSHGAGSVDNTELETATAFLDVLVKTNTDPNALKTAIENMPMVAKFYTVEDGVPVRKAA